MLVGLPENVVNPFDLNLMTAEVFHQEEKIETTQSVFVLDDNFVDRLLFHQPEQLLELGSGIAHPGANFIIRLDHLVLLLGGVGDESSHLPVQVAFLLLLVRTGSPVDGHPHLIVLLDLGFLVVTAELLDVVHLVAAMVPRRLDRYERAVAVPITERFVADAE